MNIEDRKQTLLGLFQAGVDAVGGFNATSRALEDEQFSMPVHLVAVGKAADAMARGALSELGDSVVSGLVVTKHHHLSDELRSDSRLNCIESSHPLPDEHSLAAGAALADYVSAVPAEHQMVFLVSGGASALVEHLQPGLTLDDLQAATQKLIAGGAAIGEINQHRRTLSQIKGGKLASAVKCQVLQLLISDVPGDVLGDIGSGLLIPDAATGMPDSLPVWQHIQTRLVASSAIAQSAVMHAAIEKGLTVQQSTGSLDGDINDVRERVAGVLKAASSGIYIWGGEPTVVLPDAPGRGGRNQHLALALADVACKHGALSILVCGTDGTDGPTHDAGGLVDESTCEFAASQSLAIDRYLINADAGSALQKLDQLVTTGPTGTNVMDLCIAVVS